MDAGVEDGPLAQLRVELDQVLQAWVSRAILAAFGRFDQDDDRLCLVGLREDHSTYVASVACSATGACHLRGGHREDALVRVGPDGWVAGTADEVAVTLGTNPVAQWRERPPPKAVGRAFDSHPGNVDEERAIAAAEGFSPEYVERDTEFDVESGDFSALVIRDAGKPSGFHYFYDTASRRLITDFVLVDRPQVATMCQVTLIKKDNKYSPRIRLWKKDKTGPGRGQARLEIADLPETRAIKAIVDTEDCHDNFWKLIAYLQSLSDIDLPANTFRVLPLRDATVVEMLQQAPKAERLALIRAAVGSLTEEDIQVLAGRKAELQHFERLLNEDDFFAAEMERLERRPEAVWQGFFDRNTWIFGYGLELVSCESLTDAKLEQITTGASVFAGAGKRPDALLRTRGYVSSLLFGEIKTHKTPLLEERAYRPPDVYQPAKGIVGGVAQVQKTTQKAVQAITESVHALRNPDGTPMGIEVSTVRPRQVLIAGNLRQFAIEDDINVERSSSFELYRRSINDVEIITFDELFERARYIIGDAG